jgi:hypothetical protein
MPKGSMPRGIEMSRGIEGRGSRRGGADWAIVGGIVFLKLPMDYTKRKYDGEFHSESA